MRVGECIETVVRRAGQCSSAATHQYSNIQQLSAITAGSAINAPKMQLYNDGVDQGASVTAKYIGWNIERPATEAFDGTWVRFFCSFLCRHRCMGCTQVVP
jgi:hypothetical protein